jgi:type IV pilus assembly protein PilE
MFKAVENLREQKGFTLIELLIVIAIIGILAAISVPAYIGQKKRAARTEAYANLESIRVLEEQVFAESGAYTESKGTCAKDNPGNVDLIRGVLIGFKPGLGTSLQFSYCIEQNINLSGTTEDPCFRATAFGNTDSDVLGDEFHVDCNNLKDF